jgi:hypothetical protein
MEDLAIWTFSCLRIVVKVDSSILFRIKIQRVVQTRTMYSRLVYAGVLSNEHEKILDAVHEAKRRQEHKMSSIACI